MDRLDAVVIVTGGSSGIGRATALSLAERGARVLVTARRAAALEETAAQHPGVFGLVADVATPADAARTVAAAIERWGRLDVLVNAGAGAILPLAEATAERITGIFAVTRARLKHRRRGTPAARGAPKRVAEIHNGGHMQTRSPASLRALVAGTLALATLVVAPLHAARAGEAGRVTDLMTRELPNVPGKEVTMITVDYAPGATDPVHRHDASAFIYVLEGTIEMQMEGGEKVTLKPGQTFYEEPRRVHAVGRNPSDSEPAKFVVFLVKEQGTPILEIVEP